MCSEPHCDLIWGVKENFGWAVSVVLDNFNCEADLGLGPSPVKDQWRCSAAGREVLRHS